MSKKAIGIGFGIIGLVTGLIFLLGVLSSDPREKQIQSQEEKSEIFAINKYIKFTLQRTKKMQSRQDQVLDSLEQFAQEMKNDSITAERELEICWEIEGLKERYNEELKVLETDVKELDEFIEIWIKEHPTSETFQNGTI